MHAFVDDHLGVCGLAGRLIKLSKVMFGDCMSKLLLSTDEMSSWR